MMQENNEMYGAQVESGVYESLKKMVSITDPNEAIDDLLSYIGKKCRCDRTYIFEKSKYSTVSNTYEWCAKNIVPQKELLQNEPMDAMNWWWDVFDEGRPVIMEDLESIKESHPRMYAGLKQQGIHSIIATAVHAHGDLIGFIGVDNPDKKIIQKVADLLVEIAYFLTYIIERRDLMSKLQFLSYHDQLTGAYNRHAYGEFMNSFEGDKPYGVVFCDISELKNTNDNMGHSFGDKLISYWYEMLKAVFPKERIYRIGGDEFVIFCEHQLKAEFHKSVSRLTELIYNNQNHLAIGCVWSDSFPVDVHVMVDRAEKAMYKDKASFYSKRSPITGLSRDRRQKSVVERDKVQSAKNIELSNFINSNHFDPVIFFKALAMEDFYPYIGDLQSNLFYISDEMRDTFGFQSNIVSDLLGAWEKRFCDREELEIYRRDISDLFLGKKECHDLRYRVKDKAGNDIWVHCQGYVKWNQERTEPLFFAGGVSRQERNFVVDAVTNFPQEYAATQKIREMQSKNCSFSIIGFTLNNFTEINELRGRYATNVFLGKIAKKLSKQFEKKLLFYRLDGMRFLAIATDENNVNVEETIREMKELISEVYYSNNVIIQAPCSIGVIQGEGVNKLPQDILVNLVVLLNQAKQAPEQDYLVHSQKNIFSQKNRAQLIMELNRNVIDGLKNFRIVIQPIVSTKTMTVKTGEVLLRWSFEGKDILPAVFIPMLENSRLILTVGKWVLEQAIRTCARVITYLPDFRLSVNISYYQILDSEFLPFLTDTLKKYNLSGERMILEITETHYDETPFMVKQFVENCQNLGIEVAIDDFGDGYSSLAFLIKYPATWVKLDRSLINEMVSSQDNVNFISSIVYACHKFGKKVCAEGVETEEEFKIIKDSDCDMIQGFYFYEPLELDEFYGILPNS